MSKDDKGNKYQTYTFWYKLIADYANISMLEIPELEYGDYLILRHDAFIDKMNSTEKGIEYLDNAWRIECTEQDRDSLRQKFGKIGGE